MKIYASKSNELIIDVCFEVPNVNNILASIPSEISPVHLPDGSIDEQALADYDAFVDNVSSLLYRYFDVVDNEESDKSKTSWCFYLYGKDDEGNVATKILVRLRISDHNYRSTHSKKAENEYVKKKAYELRSPKEKDHQDWKLEYIIANNREFYSYDDALDSVEDKLSKISKYLNNRR